MNPKRTKIVATIGPASASEEMLRELIKAGVNIIRLNFSHGTHDERKVQINLIRKVSQELGKHTGIMADLQGPKLRLGSFDGIMEIRKGQTITISTEPENNEVPIQFDLTPFVLKGERIFINDGLVEFKILDILGKKIKIQALNNGVISSNKGVNIPDTELKSAGFTKKDIIDAEFIMTQDVDYIALSFVQSAKDLDQLKEMIKKASSKAKIIAKIEKKSAIDNLEEIIKEADGVMVARGDLGIETKASEVPLVQEKIINLARKFQKPVIVATQMLESMIFNPRPTRAETSDVANAVLSQVDAVMLSAETANGKYPLEAVSTMREIILSVENHPEYKSNIQTNWLDIPKHSLLVSAVTFSAAQVAQKSNARFIVVTSASGKTARVLSSFRPEASIIAITHDERTTNQLQLLWGIQSLIIKPTKSYNLFWERIIKNLKERKLGTKGDNIVIISGSLVGVSGKIDTIKTVTL